MGDTRDNASSSISHHVGFRVFVYRLRLPGKFKIGKTEYDINTLLYMDSASSLYPIVSRFFLSDATHPQGDVNFNAFLSAIRSKILAGLKKGPEGLAVDRDSILEQIEITPIVSSVGVQLGINGENSCNMSMMDFALPDFDIDNVKTALGNMPTSVDLTQTKQKRNWNPLASPKADSRKAESESLRPIAERLSGFVIREFDFVRVEAYARTNESWQQRAAGLSQTTPTLPSMFSSTTQFTGLVTRITRSAGPGAVPSVTVVCGGISSVFSRGTTVFDKALAQVITREGGNNLAISQEKMNVTSNRFHNLDSKGAFLDLVDEYFFIKDKSKSSSRPSSDKEDQAVYLPILSEEAWKKNLSYASDSKPALVQFLPMLVCYHILKYLYAEPVVLMDDLLDGAEIMHMDDPGLSALPQYAVLRSKKRIMKKLRPYLTMIKTAYQLFDSSFCEPNAVFEKIRSESFFEIFEDRSGTFRFRLPRYNAAYIMHRCDPSHVISVTHEKNDSAAFNVSQSQNSLAYTGVMASRGLSGSVYLDRFSIFRYGLRMPNVVENPNAIVPGMAKAIAIYISEYNSALTSRSASVTQIINPRINLGDMVAFEFPNKKTSSGSVRGISSGDDSFFVGYVTSISESITASGQGTQSLSLSMVRPIGRINENTDRFASATTYITVKQAADLIAATVKPVANSIFRGSTNTVAVPEYDQEYTATIANKANDVRMGKYVTTAGHDTYKNFMVKAYAHQLGWLSCTSAKYIADPANLGIVAGATQGKLKEAVESINGKAPTDLTKMTRDERNAALQASGQAIVDMVDVVGARITWGEFLRDYQKGMDYTYNLQKNSSALAPDKYVKYLHDTIVGQYYKKINKFLSSIPFAGKKTPVKFTGQELTYTATTFSAQVNRSIDELIERSSRIYVGESNRTGSDWYKSEFYRLFIPSTPYQLPDRHFQSTVPPTITRKDARTADIIAKHFIYTFLADAELPLYEEGNLLQDAEAAKRIRDYKNLNEEIDAIDAPDRATSPLSSDDSPNIPSPPEAKSPSRAILKMFGQDVEA